jgi:hypothetical protein
VGRLSGPARRAHATAALLATLAIGCGGDGGLAGGTVENGDASALADGARSAEAREVLNGDALDSEPFRGNVRGGTCEVYRGVEVRDEDAVVTGELWRICFRRGAVAEVGSECPAPLLEGEAGRYREAGYRVEGSACAED